MNKKPSKFREKRGNRHSSQNNLPPIDKFHPDWWYYREEMDEPDDIDISYENESRNRNKKVIRLTESELKHIISESVRRVLREERDIDDDNYFGGGLADNYFDDGDTPDTGRISQKQIAQLDNIADIIDDISNNTSDEAELLYQASDNIREFTSRYK